jgi:hypothetical protein
MRAGASASDVESATPTIMVTAEAVQTTDDWKHSNTPVAVAAPLNYDNFYAAQPGGGRHAGVNGPTVVAARAGPGSQLGFVAIDRPGVSPEFNEAYEFELLSDRERTLVEIYRLARFVRSCCWMNIVFSILGGLYSLLNLLAIPFIVCGFYGARNYNTSLLYFYIFYCFLEVVRGMIGIFLESAVGSTVLRVIFMLFIMACAKYASRLAMRSRELTETDRTFLVTNPLILHTERGTCC